MCPVTKRFRPAVESAPRVLLHSYMGSGNTWLRIMLENVTGVYTGTVYHDLELVQQGMLGEGHTGTDVLTVKDHCVRHMRGNRSHCGQGYDKVLFLVRNPFHALVSERKRVTGDPRAATNAGSGMHTNSQPWSVFLQPDRYSGRPWAPWAVEHMHLWASSVGHMLGPACNATALAATGAPLMLLTYEALRADTPTSLARVLQFVGESPDAALCLHRAHAAGIDSTAKRGASADFPPCVFTQRQLVQLLRLAGPCFPALGYSLPAECVGVWEGTGNAAGGVDVGRGP